MRYRYVFFDLDGTVMDTGRGVKRGVQAALAQLGRPVPGEDELDFVMGPPLSWAFHDRIGLSDEETQRAVEYFQAYYESTGLYESEIYPGIPELLKRLHAQGTRTALVTGKPAEYATQLMEHFHMEREFDFICGSAKTGRDTAKWELLEQAFHLAGLAPENRREAIMVGDRMYDAEGAAKTGIDCIGVEYGFGTREELSTHGVRALAKDASELEALLCPEREAVEA